MLFENQDGDWVIKAILFDLDGVLIDETHSEYYVWADIFADAKKNTGKPAWLLKNELESSSPELNLEWFDLNAKLRKIGCTLRWEKLQKKYSNKIEVYPDVLPCLEKLKTGFKLFVVTDGYDYGQRVRIEAVNLAKYFDKIFYSNVFERLKSDGKYFPSILKELGLRGGETALVDDCEYGIVQAKKSGIKTIRIYRTGARESRADHTIRSLEELAAIIGKGKRCGFE